MGRAALTALVLASAALHGLLAQSIVFVSPSTKGLLTMSCAAGSLNSFEELHFLAASHYLAERLCSQPKIDGGVAEQLGMSESAVKVAMHRMRQRYRKLLRNQIALTVDSPGEVDDEILHLFRVFGDAD